MKDEHLFELRQLSLFYTLDTTFFLNLEEYGLLEIYRFHEVEYIHAKDLDLLEKMCRLHRELNLNLEGIDVIINLLDKIEALHEELESAKSRLSLYEHDSPPSSLYSQ